MIHSWSFMVLANCFSDLPRGMILQRIEPWFEASSGLASSWQLPGTGHVKCGLVWRLRTPNPADYQQMLILTVVKRIEMVVFGCIMIIHDICIHTHIYIYVYLFQFWNRHYVVVQFPSFPADESGECAAATARPAESDVHTQILYNRSLAESWVLGIKARSKAGNGVTLAPGICSLGKSLEFSRLYGKIAMKSSHPDLDLLHSLVFVNSHDKNLRQNMPQEKALVAEQRVKILEWRDRHQPNDPRLAHWNKQFPCVKWASCPAFQVSSPKSACAPSAWERSQRPTTASWTCPGSGSLMRPRVPELSLSLQLLEVSICFSHFQPAATVLLARCNLLMVPILWIVEGADCVPLSAARTSHTLGFVWKYDTLKLDGLSLFNLIFPIKYKHNFRGRIAV